MLSEGRGQAGGVSDPHTLSRNSSRGIHGLRVVFYFAKKLSMGFCDPFSWCIMRDNGDPIPRGYTTEKKKNMAPAIFQCRMAENPELKDWMKAEANDKCAAV